MRVATRWRIITLGIRQTGKRSCATPDSWKVRGKEQFWRGFRHLRSKRKICTPFSVISNIIIIVSNIGTYPVRLVSPVGNKVSTRAVGRCIPSGPLVHRTLPGTCDIIRNKAIWHYVVSDSTPLLLLRPPPPPLVLLGCLNVVV